jgi:uncharacterized protein DUF3999
MNRRRAHALLLLCASAAGGASAADLSPADFGYGMEIRTPVTAEAYRVTVPYSVYAKVTHEDLRDLRLFDARGEAVPYEIESTPVRPATESEGAPLPLFAIPRNAYATLDGVQLIIRSPQGAVELRAGATRTGAQPTASYVLDAREVKSPVSALILHWPEQAPEFSGHIRIEASDGLGTWRLVAADVPVVNLRSSGATLVQGRLSFASTTAGFWRLNWLDQTAPFDLTAVTPVLAGQPVQEGTSSVTLTRSADEKSGGVAFDLGARIPVTAINVVLPQPNSAVKLEVLSRARPTDPWRTVATEEFYRVRKDGSERRNEPAAILANTDRYWLVRPVGPATSLGDIRLEASWKTVDVVFLARGSRPFLLAYGNGTVAGAGVPLARLLKGVTVSQAELGPPRALGGEPRLTTPRRVPWKIAILWAVLGLGVALLGWMAYRLSTELRPGKS